MKKKDSDLFLDMRLNNTTQEVPAFFPKLSSFEEPETYQVNPLVFRIHMFSALWFVWIAGILEVIEGLREIRVFDALWTLY